MGEMDLPRWTPALVLAELRRAMRPLVIRAPPRYSLPEPEEALPPPDVVALAERVLGRGSPEYRALLILTKPDISIREWCRELARSRATLYRRAARGAATMAERLNADGVAPPVRYVNRRRSSAIPSVN